MKHAVVTGAGRGLGRGVARALARDGWHVWICSEVQEELQRTETLIRHDHGAVTSVCVDLGDPAGCDRLVESVFKGAEALGVVCNAAAVLRRQAIHDHTLADWLRTLAINLTAPFLIARDLMPLLTQGGSIINVSSRAGVEPFPHEAAYCASKFALEAFSRCLALELVDRPISVNTITPGAKIKPTSVTDRDLANVPREQQDTWVDPLVLGPAFVFLASLRGEVSGRRFDAQKLSDAIVAFGRTKTLDQIATLYEPQ